MSIKRTKTLTYFFILVGTFFVFFIQPPFAKPVKSTVYNLTELPLRIVLFPFQELKKILTYHRTYDQYLQLTVEVNTLKARLTGLDEVFRENNRLEKLLEFKRKLIFSSIAANVIGRDPSNWNSTMIIDKGEKDGLSLGMPVVNAQGVVGKVTEVNDHRAKVILISDPSFSIAALGQRSREFGLVSGTLQGLCRMRYLSPDADVTIGDQIITSKLSSSFPEGLIIGEVIDIHSHGNSLSLDCVIQPAVSLFQIEEVLVIQKK